jgi:hypothetical protein
MIQSFLEYVCRELLDNPVHGASWFCPLCDPNGELVAADGTPWPSFSVRPPLENYPIRWRCHRCNRWGDEYDLVKRIYPSLSYKSAELMLVPILERFRRDHPASPARSKMAAKYPGLREVNSSASLRDGKPIIAQTGRTGTNGAGAEDGRRLKPIRPALRKERPK